MSKVLVTGGSGFVAGYCILGLLKAGHEVRTSVRNLKREGEVRSTLEKAGAPPGHHLHFFEADLTDEKGWSEAIQGCDYVLHVASPFPMEVPKDKNEIIVPAREGTLRILRLARDFGVQRVVITSSFAAIGYGHPSQAQAFDETSWSNVENEEPYIQSKAIAEKAAWDFMAKEGGNLELAVINPTGIFGPALGPDLSGSIGIIKNMMDGAMPALPCIYFGVVDVRDVADLHLLAMTDPKAKGQRFIAVAGPSMSLPQIAKLLRNRMGKSAAKVSKITLPNWLMRVIGFFNPKVRPALAQLGKVRNASNEKAKRVLGWNPRPSEECIIATAESLVQQRLLKNT